MSMSKVLNVQGGQPLNGTVAISGAKNAILPLMAATILTDRPIKFDNVPDISDVRAMILLLQSYGVKVDEDWRNKTLTIRAKEVRGEPLGLHAKIGRTFRASILVLGPLLVRCHKAVIYAPGGDDISRQGRGNDFHITSLGRMRASVNISQDRSKVVQITAEIPSQGVQAANIVFPKVSVGATQHIMMTACAASGRTTIEQASIEPETMDLVKLLRAMGASINVNKKQRKITIDGKPIHAYFSTPFQRPIEHAVIPDRIEAGTYAIAAAITRGSVTLQMNVGDAEILNLLEAEFWRLLASASVEITRIGYGTIRVASKPGAPIQPVSVKTRPYPGFPTDMHPQWAALMCFSNGECWIEEGIFDARFKYVEGLRKIVGEYTIFQDGNKVRINGLQLRQRPELGYWNQQPQANDVTTPDIRAGAALILAALAQPELTVIRDIHHVERGYEDFVTKFQQCGASIEMVELRSG